MASVSEEAPVKTADGRDKESDEDLSPDSVLIEERERRKKQTMLLTTFEFRREFGEVMSSKWGFFVDHYLSAQIHEYADWVVYPTQDHLMREYSSYLQCGLVSSDGFFFYCIRSNQVHLCDLETGQELAAWKYQLRYFLCAAHRAGLLAVGGNDGSLYYLNDRNLKLIRERIFLHSTAITSLNFNQSGDRIFSCGRDLTLRVSNVETGERLVSFGYHGQGFSSVLSLDGFALWLRSNVISLMDPLERTTVQSIRSTHLRSAGHITVNCDSSLIACPGSISCLIYQWPSMERVYRIKPCYMCVEFHPSKPFLLAIADSDDQILIKDVRQSIEEEEGGGGEPLALFKGHTDRVKGLCFTPDGSRLISVSDDRTCRMWNISHLL